MQGLSHSEAIAIFKQIRSGPVVLQTGRRTQQQQQQIMVNILISRVFLDKNLGIYNIVPTADIAEFIANFFKRIVKEWAQKLILEFNYINTNSDDFYVIQL